MYNDKETKHTKTDPGSISREMLDNLCHATPKKKTAHTNIKLPCKPPVISFFLLPSNKENAAAMPRHATHYMSYLIKVGYVDKRGKLKNQKSQSKHCMGRMYISHVYVY